MNIFHRMNKLARDIMGQKIRLITQFMGVSFVVVVSYMLLSCCQLASCSYAAVKIPSLSDKPRFTKEKLLERKRFTKDNFPKITTSEDIKSLKTYITKDHGTFPDAVRIDIMAVVGNEEYSINEESGIFVLRQKKPTVFKFRVFFLDEKFHNGKVKEIEFSFSKKVIARKNVYILFPKNIFYEKNSFAHTINGDEIHWIKDRSGPSIYALLVCDGQCNTSSSISAKLDKYKCEYKIGSHETLQDCTEYFRDASQDFVKKVGQNITEKTTLKLTMTINPIVEKVPQTGPVYPGESKKEKKENGGTATKESKDTSGDKVKLVALQKVQFKPYTYLYGEPFDTAKICDYKYEFIDGNSSTTTSNIALTKTTAAGQDYFLAKDASKRKQVKTGDKLTVKVTPKLISKDYCFSGKIKTFPVSLNEKIATAEFEIPHLKPWLLVYATSAGFPHDSDNIIEKTRRWKFWARIYGEIDKAYTISQEPLHWLTVDVFKPIIKKEPDWLAGGHEKGNSVSKIGLSDKQLTNISQIPPEDISPSFEYYKEAILAYKKKHSTQNNGKHDNVVIIQGKDSFSRSICKNFNTVAPSLEKQGINILYINPVSTISIKNSTEGNGVLEQLVGSYPPIYICTQPNKQIVSRLITFNYFDHQENKWQSVQNFLEGELNNIKN